MAALTDDDIRAILSQQVAQAAKHDDDELVASRTKALDYFFGRMNAYVPPEPNRSKVVSRDVADTMGWIMPQMMRVFLNSTAFAIAEPVEKEDVQFADQATLGLNHVFFKGNDGEAVCYNATWEALLFGDGIVKTYWDDTPQYAVSFHSGLMEDQAAMLLSPNEDGEAPEVLASSQRMEMVEDFDGRITPLPVYDIKIRRQKAKGRFVIEAIPRDHYRKNAGATCPDDALFQSHVERKTRSELVEMGYDRALVWSIPAGTNVENEDYRGYDIEQDALDKATEEVDYHECYAVLDVDDDGVAETIRACLGGPDGGVLLDWEVWEDDAAPFDVVQYEPIPHRFEGRSVFDETNDVQDVKTVLKRQALNNTYATNNPQRLVKGKVHNPEELTSPSFNGAVFGDATTEIVPMAVPFVANHAYEALAYEDEVIQRRTGVGRQSMALDPETLQNQSATANQNNKDAAYSQVELAARNMARGWKKVFRKLLRLMIKHQDTPMSLRLKGDQFVAIDPRHWNADMDITINVGLGTGSRDRDMMMLQQVLMNQMALADRFLATGAKDQAIDMLPLVIDTMTKIAEAAGLKNPGDYYPENAEALVEQLKQQAAAAAQQPNPELLKEQAKIEATKEIETMKAQGNAVKEQAQLEADLQTKEADRQNAMVLEEKRQEFEREKLEREYAFRVWETNQRMALEREKMASAATIASMKTEPEPSGAAAN